MFLALKEIAHEKLRYGLIIALVTLVSFLIFILTSLAQGLASQNTAAINSWHTRQIVLNKDANTNLAQSLITTQDAAKLRLGANEAYVGQAPVVLKGTHRAKQSAQFIGLEPHQYIAQHLQLVAGHMPKTDHEIVLDTSLKNAGYKLGDHVRLNTVAHRFTVVGFTKNAKLSIAPVIYGRLASWPQLKNIPAGFKASAVVSKRATLNGSVGNLTTVPVAKFIQQLPGYAAQNMTFEFMIGFLLVISLIVIAVFLYIITMQKLSQYAVLRAQGIPARVLVSAVLIQAVLLTVIGLILGAALTAGTFLVVPAAVPLAVNLPLLSGVSVALIGMALLGALIPVRTILKVDPVTVIGG